MQSRPNTQFWYSRTCSCPWLDVVGMMISAAKGPFASPTNGEILGTDSSEPRSGTDVIGCRDV